MPASPNAFRNAVLLVALLNLSYFGIEFSVALSIGAVSLLADSIDFLEDTTINFLIIAALGWSAYKKSMVGMLLAVLLLAPGVATLWMAWQKIMLSTAPAAAPLGMTGLGALLVNFLCAWILVRFKHHDGSLSHAAYLSARNDVIGNAGIIIASLLTAFTLSAWPDIIVGLAIFAINLDASREVFEAARAENIQART